MARFSCLSWLLVNGVSLWGVAFLPDISLPWEHFLWLVSHTVLWIWNCVDQKLFARKDPDPVLLSLTISTRDSLHSCCLMLYLQRFYPLLMSHAVSPHQRFSDTLAVPYHYLLTRDSIYSYCPMQHGIVSPKTLYSYYPMLYLPTRCSLHLVVQCCISRTDSLHSCPILYLPTRDSLHSCSPQILGTLSCPVRL